MLSLAFQKSYQHLSEEVQAYLVLGKVTELCKISQSITSQCIFYRFGLGIHCLFLKQKCEMWTEMCEVIFLDWWKCFWCMSITIILLSLDFFVCVRTLAIFSTGNYIFKSAVHNYPQGNTEGWEWRIPTELLRCNVSGLRCPETEPHLRWYNSLDTSSHRPAFLCHIHRTALWEDNVCDSFQISLLNFFMLGLYSLSPVCQIFPFTCTVLFTYFFPPCPRIFRGQQHSPMVMLLEGHKVHVETFPLDSVHITSVRSMRQPTAVVEHLCMICAQ